MWPHLTTVEVLAAMALFAAWLVSDWVLKLLIMLEAIKRYRK
jgi:hypothetical protein